MEFRTKREAEEAAQDMEGRTRSARTVPWWRQGEPEYIAQPERDAALYDAEAARIRALLPTLPEK